MKIEKVDLKFKGTLKPIPRVDTIVIHHPASETATVQDIHAEHLAKGWVGIGYNYYITKDGRIFEGRGKHIGAHCEGENSHSLGVCFQGNYETNNNMTDRQVESGGWLVSLLIREYGLQINDIKKHKDMPKAATVCPGRYFRWDDLKQSILEWTNPNIKKEVAGVTYIDTQPPQKWRLETGTFADTATAEKMHVEFDDAFPELAKYSRVEGVRIVTGTWPSAAAAEEYKKKVKQEFGWWVYIREA